MQSRVPLLLALFAVAIAFALGGLLAGADELSVRGYSEPDARADSGLLYADLEPPPVPPAPTTQEHRPSTPSEPAQ